MTPSTNPPRPTIKHPQSTTMTLSTNPPRSTIKQPQSNTMTPSTNPPRSTITLSTNPQKSTTLTPSITALSSQASVLPFSATSSHPLTSQQPSSTTTSPNSHCHDDKAQWCIGEFYEFFPFAFKKNEKLFRFHDLLAFFQNSCQKIAFMTLAFPYFNL